MSAGDLLACRLAFQLEAAIDSTLAELRAKGEAGHVRKDLHTHLSPPELATWTAGQERLVLLHSGRYSWLELRGSTRTLSGGKLWVTLRTERASENFTAVVSGFASRGR